MRAFDAKEIFVCLVSVVWVVQVSGSVLLCFLLSIGGAFLVAAIASLEACVSDVTEAGATCVWVVLLDEVVDGFRSAVSVVFSANEAALFAYAVTTDTSLTTKEANVLKVDLDV